jgi:hypothetical protein
MYVIDSKRCGDLGKRGTPGDTVTVVTAGNSERKFTLSNLHLELSFETGEIVSPVARIYVKMWMGRENDPLHYISQDCAFTAELDFVVDRLIGELEDIRKRGHAKFAAAK